jgi:tetratricopeptide (TPR) repeat protein
MTEVPAPPRGCPDPSILAAFVEGTLDAQTRREVERHVADCFECPVVIAETAQFLQAESEELDGEADPPLRSQWWRIATAAAFAGLCVLGIWQLAARRDPLGRLKQIAAQSPTRLVEGQLSGFEYAPFSIPRSDRPADIDLALRAEAGHLSEGKSLHTSGVALLVVGNAVAAIPLLETAARTTPDDPTMWIDLAAAYIAAGSRGDRANLISALDAADRSIKIAPTSAAAHFNRAVALERLLRPKEAIHEYERALALESRPEWRTEIASRISRLQP